jgi:hypothetical protein
MKKLFWVMLAGSLFAMACAGRTSSSITVNLASADGLAVGQPVRLNGVDIGEVSAVGFQEGSDGVAAQLSIRTEDLPRLDPSTLFVVIRSKEEGPPRVMVASNRCTEAPQGLADGAVLEGYSGPLAQVVFQASRDRPACAAALVEGLLRDLQGTVMQLEDRLTPPPQ